MSAKLCRSHFGLRVSRATSCALKSSLHGKGGSLTQGERVTRSAGVLEDTDVQTPIGSPFIAFPIVQLVQFGSGRLLLGSFVEDGVESQQQEKGENHR